MEKLLKKIGLEPKEIAIYLALTEYGPRPASFIAQKTKLNRSSIYYLVETMVKRQIIMQSDRAGVTYFAVGDPKDLIVYLKKQARQIKSLQQEIKEALPELEALHNSHNSWKPKFYYFHGQREVKNLLEKTLANKQKTLWAMISIYNIHEKFGEGYFDRFIQRRIKKEIELNCILSGPKDRYHNRWKTSDDEYRNLKRLPPEHPIPDMSFYLWDNRYCAFISSKKENYGLLIESEEFFQTQKILFESLWGKAKRVEADK